jgi:hypothetical protein
MTDHPDEVDFDCLSPVPIKKQTDGFVKPKFTYYQVPKHLKPILDRLNLDFMKESNEQHFSKCPATFDERKWWIENVTTYFAEEYEELVDDLARKGVSTGDIPVSRYNAWARKIILNEFDGMPCPLEVAAVCDILEHLQKSYDLENPKIFLLVRELLNQYLIGIRIDKIIVDESMFQTVMNKQGQTFTIPHSGMKTKADFSKLFIEFIQVLDDITREGVKVSIEGEISLPMLMKKIIDIDKNRQPEVIDITPEVKQTDNTQNP